MGSVFSYFLDVQILFKAHCHIFTKSLLQGCITTIRHKIHYLNDKVKSIISFSVYIRNQMEASPELFQVY